MELKFLQARDTVMAVMKAMKLTTEEMKQVLQMCNDEVDAWENRSKIVEVNKDGEDDVKRD